MSLWKGLLTAGAGHAMAHNAHMAELILEQPWSTQVRITVGQFVFGAMAHLNPAYADDVTAYMVFKNSPRIVQLNLLGAAFDQLRMSYGTEAWMPVKDPFKVYTDEQDIAINISHFRRKYGVTVGIKDGSFDLGEWVEHRITPPTPSAPPPRYVEDARMVRAIRKKGAELHMAPTSITTDEQILTIYNHVYQAFKSIAAERNDSLADEAINWLVMVFLQCFENEGQEAYTMKVGKLLMEYYKHGRLASMQREITFL